MSKNYPSITLVYDRYKKASLTRKASVEVRITYDYKQKYISTGIMLYSNQWKKGIITNCPDILQISQSLEKIVNDIRQVILNMQREGNIDIFSIPSKLKKMGCSKLTFIEFCKQRTEIRKYGKTKDSQDRYNRFLKYFILWGKIINFEDVKESNIIAYDRYLYNKGMKTYSKWNNYHRFLNSFIMDAIEEGLLNRNPYKWINIDKGKNNKGIERCLNPEEFKRIKNVNLVTKSLERVRDLFIFQTYTCMSYSDLQLFKVNMVEDIQGTKVYVGQRKKTSKTFTIPLLPPALKVLEKYNNQLPLISNVKYNEYLKIVAQAAGIDKPLSSHWARHTGATMLLNDGVDMKIVSKICGHSSTRITEQVYAKLLDETVVKALQGVDSLE